MIKDYVFNKTKNMKRAAALLIIAIVLLWLGLSKFYSLTPREFVIQSGRVIGTKILSHIYHDDIKFVENTTKGYYVGNKELLKTPTLKSWKNIEKKIKGFYLVNYVLPENNMPAIPFVYEDPNAIFLSEFRNQFKLFEIVKGIDDEYEAMLKIGAWVGTRWDHGTDNVPGGNKLCDPVAVVMAGENGNKFWCEIAAKLMVLTATSLGWAAETRNRIREWI